MECQGFLNIIVRSSVSTLVRTPVAECNLSLFIWMKCPSWLVLCYEIEGFNVPCGSIIQLCYTSTNVKCEHQVPFTSSSYYFVLFFCTRVHKQMILGRDTIISVLWAQKLLLLIITVCHLFLQCNLYCLSSWSRMLLNCWVKACSSLEFHHMAVRHKWRTNYIDELLHFYSCMYALLFSVYEKHYELNALTLLLR